MATLREILSINGSITSMASPDPENIFFTEQSGILWRYNIPSGKITLVLDISDIISDLYEQKPMGMPFPDERGLLKVTFHPEYNKHQSLYNGTFFIVYSALSDDEEDDNVSHLAQLRYSDDPDELREGMTSILTVPEPQANHNMGEMVFDLEGFLWVGVGDGGGANDKHGPTINGDYLGNAQNLYSLRGKVLRIEPQQFPNPPLIPQTNPFVGGGGLPEIAAWGFRNPWSMSLDKNGDILVGDVGQNRKESVKLIEKLGENHGWRAYEGFELFSEPIRDYIGATKAPVLDYGRSYGVAITGVMEYNGDIIFSDLSGKVMMVEDREIKVIVETEKGIHGMGKDFDGEPYILTYGEGVGSIMRLIF